MERRTLVYTLILTLLIAALAAVGVLILRQRSMITSPNAVTGDTAGTKRVPTDTKSYESLPKEEAWQPDIPIPTTGFDLYPEAPDLSESIDAQ